MANASKSCMSRRRPLWYQAAALFVASVWSISPASSFQVRMAYRPPVKSSVSKFHERGASGAGGLDSRGYLTGGGGGGSSSSSRAKSGAAFTTPSRSSTSTLKRAHALAYGGAPPPTPTSPASPVSSFERRMRNLVLGAPTATGGSSSRTKRETPGGAHTARMPPNVHMVHNLRDYKELVGDERHKMVVVRFYADWCRACKAVAPLYYRMALKHPNAVFVEVPVTEQNAALHQGLGVPSLPFAHLYHPQSGLVEETKLTRRQVASFQTKLDSYLRGRCDLSERDAWTGDSEEDDATAP